MKTIISGLWAILSWIFTVSLTLLWGLGIVHSVKKHSNIDAVISFFPPWGIYRGAESFWHKDDDNSATKNQSIDWDKRIPNDIMTACQLIFVSDDNSDIDNVKMQIESFSKKISGYPMDKRKKIEEGVKMFLKYNVSATDDLNNYINELSTDSSIIFKYGITSSRLYDSLYNYYQLPMVKQLKDAGDSQMIKVDFKTLPKAQLNYIVEKSKEKLNITISEYHIQFKNIFNEDYN